ncbi:LacI family DNA-binding transcriptional regulator [Rugosimonospora acidiphila]|uniref:LacI family DNA-binding transcriptional regulator n=1 Tax=Rugosimonospora acidiphila TaxID=556531 RepID=A0ABP9SP20_9ACTN
MRPETRERVLAAMAELGYSPNHAARALRVGSFGVIGVIAHQLNRTGESRTIEAVVEAAGREQYSISLVDVETPSTADVSAAVHRLTHQSIDGLMIIRAEDGTPPTLALPPGLPVVVSDSRFVGHHPVVSTDHRGGARLAVEHLLVLGHRTVHHLAGPADSGSSRVRAEAWRHALRAAGREVPPVLRGDWSPESGYAVGRKVAGDPDVTAVFAANDEMAVGLMAAFADAGVAVPGDVSVVGFDDVALAGFLRPALTTVRQDFTVIGLNLVDLLVRQIRGEGSLDDEHLLVPAQLVIRSSTASPAPHRRP